jgi:3-oxoacyl-[acyl-carrier protein] reductase
VNLDLDGKVVLVTGGSKGIGRAAALAFACEGAKVVIGARQLERLNQAAEEIREKSGRSPLAIKVDTTHPGQVSELMSTCLSKFGRCDVLVNAAGYGRGGRFVDLDEAAWKQGMEAKYFGYVRVARAILPLMIKQNFGCIINVIGVGGREFLPSNIVGGAANAALYLLTKGMAHELAGNGIRVNGVSPGHIDTERWRAVVDATAKTRRVTAKEAEEYLVATVPLGRVGLPEEVADAILFLASSRASYITGTCLSVDGGRTRSF